MATPRSSGISKSEHARQLYAAGCRDMREIADATGLSAGGVWYALRNRPEQTVETPDGPTFWERETGKRLATMRGSALERADEIAKELAAARRRAQGDKR